MKQTTLFVSVGRASPRPLCTVSDDSPSYEATLAAMELRERMSLLNGGNDAERISFVRDDSEQPETPAAKSKGKGR